MRESQIEKALVRRIKLLGGDVRKVGWIGRRGAPDRLVLLPYETARLLVARLYMIREPEVMIVQWQHSFVELKRPGKVADLHQAREHERLRAAGFIVLTIATLEDVERWFPAGLALANV